MIGKTLAHYKVTEQIGAGGMGEVYRAQDTRLGRDVALKLLPESFAADADRLSRFEREAKLLAGLNHTNIASIYGIEEFEGQRFLVLELVEGVDLAKRLAEGPLIVDDALAIGYQIAEGLEAAHEQGVVHRDLKPANVIVAPNGTVKVLDFGLARAVDSESSAASDLSHSPTVMASSPTMQGVILGTAPYMSPEQARGRAVDRRADIWAFGVVMLEMLTAKRVFDGETVSDTLASVIKTEPDWEGLPESTPRPIVRLLKRCLDKDPRKRLRDIGEARVIIDQVLRGELVEDEAPSGTGTTTKRNPVPVIITAVLVAAIAGAAAWFMKPGAPEPPLRKFSLVVKSDEGETPFNPRISPDGTMVAYCREGKLFVQELDQLQPREVYDGDAHTPFWSPDSHFLGFVDDDTLWKIPVSGGNVVKISKPGPGFTGGHGAVWSENDRIIWAHGSSAIFDVSANGGDPREYVTLASDEADFHEPSLLPDGKGLLFVVHPKASSPDRIHIQAGDRRIPVVRVDNVRLGDPAYSPSGHIVYHRSGSNGGIWAVPFSLDKLEVTGESFPVDSDAAAPSVSRDGTLVFLRGSTSQNVNLVWVSRDGTISDPVSDTRPNYFDPCLSPDGTHLAVCEWDGTEIDIWIHDLQRRTRTRFTFAEGAQTGPEWTPDGSEIIYHDARGDTIYARNADGTGSPRFLAVGREPSLSVDGKFLAYHVQGGTTQEDMGYADLAGGGDPKPFIATPAREGRVRISPNGRYVAYESDESGEIEIYITRFPSGDGKWQVSTNNGTRPRWSRDGASLFYQEDNCDIMEVSVSYDPALTLGTPRLIADCGELGLQGGFGREYELDPTGQRILFTKAVATEGDRIDVGITVVENWAREFAE